MDVFCDNGEDCEGSHDNKDEAGKIKMNIFLTTSPKK